MKPSIIVRSGYDQTLQVCRTTCPCCNKRQVVFAMPNGDFELSLDEAIVCVSRLRDEFLKWRIELRNKGSNP